MISDQLAFVRVAKEYLTSPTCSGFAASASGRGKIGGKAAGMVLAWKILQQTFASMADGATPVQLVIPESYFVGADVFYDFLASTTCGYYMNQKYKPIDQIEQEYPELQAAYLARPIPGRYRASSCATCSTKWAASR